MARTSGSDVPRQPAGRAASAVGPSARGVLREIDAQLERIERQLEAHEQLIAERDRLLAARHALMGQGPAREATGRRVSQDDIAAYLQKNPGSLPGQIAEALNAPVTNISQHLYRGKDTRFVRRQNGWHLRGLQKRSQTSPGRSG